MPPIGNNITLIRNSLYFKKAEYLDDGNVIVDMKDGRKIKIFRVPAMKWLIFYCSSTEAEIHELMRHHSWSFEN